MPFIVAIDGPAGTGKGTVTNYLAKKLNLVYIDTGAIYRCVTLKLLKEKVNFDDVEKIKEVLKNINIEFNKDKVFLDGEDVTLEIRKDLVNNNVSQVSHILEVRQSMVDLQRKMSEGKDVILEGRDIGTNVFPNADVKIYLDASVDERVKRRIKQNNEKGIECTEKEVRENIEFRDNNDKTSKIGPLRQAEDAVYVDTTNLSIKEVEHKLYKLVKSKKRDDRWIERGYITTKNTWFKRLSRKVIKGFLAGLYRIFFRVKITGQENLNLNEGFIICANHVNYLDAAAIILFNKKFIRFVAKSDLYRIPILSYLGHIFDVIPIRRGKNDIASIKMCLKALKNNEILGIFPEGTRQGLAKNVKIKNGAIFLAEKAKVKIVPVGIGGTFKLFSKVRINYGEPIDIMQYKTDDPEWLDNASADVMKKIIELRDKDTVEKSTKK